jgi:hypothetical protein
LRANLDLSRGLIVSEAVMMGLAPYLGRERSPDLVYDICSEVSAGNGIFLDLSPRIRRSRRICGVMRFPNFWPVLVLHSATRLLCLRTTRRNGTFYPIFGLP